MVLLIREVQQSGAMLIEPHGDGFCTLYVDDHAAAVCEYKGNAMITIHGGMRPFGFGFRKAELIIEVIEDIKQFVSEQRKIKEEEAAKKAKEEG